MKYFYKDHGAAGWMAYQFGMRFTNAQSNCELFYNRNRPFPFCWEPSTFPGCGYNGNQWYIYHPSLILLEPQIGDLIERPANETQSEDWCLITTEVRRRALMESGADFKIIRRKNTLFAWPEGKEP